MKKSIAILLTAIAAVCFAFLTSTTAQGPGYNSDGFAFSGLNPPGTPITSPVYLEGFEDPQFLNQNVGVIFDGRFLWVLPHTGNEIIQFDPVADMTVGRFSFLDGTNMGNTNSKSKPFYGGVFDGINIWMIPYESDSVIQFDTTTGSMTGYPIPNNPSMGNSATVSTKFYGGTFDGQNVWMTPHDATALVKFDTTSLSFTGYPLSAVTNRGTITSENYKFSSAQFDGTDVWLIPDHVNRVVRVNVSTGAMTGYDLTAGTDIGDISTLISNKKGLFRVSTYDGRYIWMVPQAGNSLIRLDPTDASMKGFLLSADDMGNTLSQVSKFTGAAYDGRFLWMVPRDANRIWKFDTYTETFKTQQLVGTNLDNSISTNARFYGSVFDGTNIWCSPLNATRLVKIAPTGNLSGTVTDRDTGLPIEGASVAIENSEGVRFSALSDENGAYAFTDIPIGIYNIAGTKEEYDDSPIYTDSVMVSGSTIVYIELQATGYQGSGGGAASGSGTDAASPDPYENNGTLPDTSGSTSSGSPSPGGNDAANQNNNRYPYAVEYFLDSTSTENIISTVPGHLLYNEGHQLTASEVTMDLGSSWVNLKKPQGYNFESPSQVAFPVISKNTDNNIVRVVYKKPRTSNTTVNYTVVVKYLDTSGKVLAAADITSFEAGSRNVFRARDISGFELTQTNMDGRQISKTSSVSIDPINRNYEIVFIYKSKKTDLLENTDIPQHEKISPTDIRPPRLETDRHEWYIRGNDKGQIMPESNLTRAEAAMIFFRLIADADKVSYTPVKVFPDVDTGKWYARAVSYLFNYDIISGYPDGSFRPDAPVTRAEAAKISSKFDKLDLSGENVFSDVPASHWAKPFIESATRKGWLVGYGDGTFHPDSFITRAEFITHVNRVLNRKFSVNQIGSFSREAHLWPDVPLSYWAAADIMEATHSHLFEREAHSLLEAWTKITGIGFDSPAAE